MSHPLALLRVEVKSDAVASSHVYYLHGTGPYSIGAISNGDDARRIAACWNACAGLDTGHLEKYGLPGFAEKISALVEERDALLAALIEFEAYDLVPGAVREAIKENARAAIASVNGK